MSRNGSGTYSFPSGSFNPAVVDTTIDQTDWNTLADDLETAISESIARDGQTTTTAQIPFASGISTDTIAEKTSATGVTIDSVLLKDGRVDTAKGSDIASSATTDISAPSGNYVDITGTTTITGLGTATAGRIRILKFEGALTLTHHATSLILPGGANITTADGDIAIFVSEGSGNWRCVNYSRAAGTPVLYTESTWTPVLTFATAGDVSVTYTTQLGRYTRNGRVVSADFFLLTNSFTHTTASGDLRITGLPFTSANDSNSPIGAVLWSGITKASYTSVVARVEANVAYVNFVASGSGQSASNVAAADLPTGGTVQLRGTIAYTV